MSVASVMERNISVTEGRFRTITDKITRQVNVGRMFKLSVCVSQFNRFGDLP